LCKKYELFTKQVFTNDLHGLPSDFAANIIPSLILPQKDCTQVSVLIQGLRARIPDNTLPCNIETGIVENTNTDFFANIYVFTKTQISSGYRNKYNILGIQIYCRNLCFGDTTFRQR
jgi:hypothetical protein